MQNADRSYAERLRQVKGKIYSSGTPYVSPTDKGAENMLIRIESQNPHRRLTPVGAVVAESCCSVPEPILRDRVIFYNATPGAPPDDDRCDRASSRVMVDNSEVYVTRYNTDGQIQWFSLISGDANDNGLSVTSFNGKCCVAGIFTSPTLAIYNQGSGVVARTLTYDGPGSRCIFIVMYDADGNVEWAARSTNIGPDIVVVSVAAGPTGIYVTGSFTSSSVRFYTDNDSSSSVLMQASGAIATGFLVKYYFNGSSIYYANTFNPPSGGRVICNGITSSSSTMYITGEVPCTGSTIFKGVNIGSDITLTINSAAASNAFLVAYDDMLGNPLWYTRIGGTTANKSDVGMAVTTNSIGHVYVTGYYKTQDTKVYDKNNTIIHTINNISNGSSIFVVKYPTDISPIWVSYITAPDSTPGFSPQGNAITTDANNVYVNCILGPGTATCYDVVGTSPEPMIISTNNLSSALIAFTSDTGTFVFTRVIDGAEDSTDNVGYGIGGITDGFYTVGTYTASPLLIQDSGTEEYVLANDGFADGYLIKYDGAGAVQWRTRVGGSGYQDITWVAAIASGGCYIVGNYGSGLA